MNTIRVTASHFGKTCGAICIFLVIVALTPAQAQPPDVAGSAVVEGHARDAGGRPLANVTVFLQASNERQNPVAPPQIAHTDSEGMYRFATLREGAYTLRAEMKGYAETTAGPVNLAQNETKNIDLTLVPSRAPEFFDEPQFTVAGVTQATNSGGHGSDTVLRTTEALAKATASLSKKSDGKPDIKPNAAPLDVSVSSLHEALAHNPKDAALHHQLGDVEEKLGNPLEAVREYQRAAELDPSEINLFDWGAELLAHRALEPATEVFTKGNRLFPKSVRMSVALGVAWYARGSYDQAEQCLINASDLAPDNPTPYFFLGKMLTVETTPSDSTFNRLERFARLHPDNALANFYYAVALSKKSAKPSPDEANLETDRSAKVEALLQKAVNLDAKLGAAYLQLGILYAQRAEYSHAIAAYQKAIEVTPDNATPELDSTIEEAHYRLAQAYQRIGERAKSQEQLELHTKLALRTKEETERELRDVQEFVISQRSNDSASPPP